MPVIMKYAPLRLVVLAILSVWSVTTSPRGYAAVSDARQALRNSRSETATYVLKFESSWSAATHPTDFPPNPHFSGLIGGTHDASVSFWDPGAIASDGIENMAERGSKSPLQDEVNSAISAGSAQFLISGGGISVSPGEVSVSFDITDDYPLVSVVSMVAPSPDWFVGVSGLSLKESGVWAQEVVVSLTAYDAGTDSGITYTSPDADTDPPGVITALTTPPFDMDNVVGTFTFTLQSSVGREPAPDAPKGFSVSPPFPNPASQYFQVEMLSGTAQPVHVALFDAAGRRVSQGEFLNLTAGVASVLRFDASALAGQIYFLRVAGGDGTTVVRPVLVRR